MSKAYLVLSDGTVFEGAAFGAAAQSIGELVSNTGVMGYIETLTDPSYYGQIVMQTFPQIGNYGIIEADFEGQCRVKGYVVREWCRHPSNFRCEYDLDKFLKDHGVPGICGVDTRAITQHIRDRGVMNAMICSQVPASLDEIKAYAIRDAVQAVSTGATEIFPAQGDKKYDVTLIDFGAKANIERELQRRGCEVKVVPAGTLPEAILAGHPDGVMLSNGPGDPAENLEYIEHIRQLLGKVPIFGICLGHQLTALAVGGRTVKLKYGRRPMVLSEFGGYACKPAGHAFNPTGTYGYRFFEEQADFEDALVRLYEEEILPAVGQGLCAAVYTQVSDVEDETNGLLSYDRKVTKADPKRMKAIAEEIQKILRY